MLLEGEGSGLLIPWTFSDDECQLDFDPDTYDISSILRQAHLNLVDRQGHLDQPIISRGHFMKISQEFTGFASA